MNNTVKTWLPPLQPSTPTAGTRGGFPRRGSEGSTGFDTVLADHATLPRSPQPDPNVVRPDRGSRADKYGTTRASDQTTKPGRVAKRTHPNAVRSEDGVAPLGARTKASPAAADPANPITADAIPETVAAAPTGAGVGVVPVLDAIVQAKTSATASGVVAVAALAPGMGSGGNGLAVTALGVFLPSQSVVVPGQIGAGTPTGPGIGAGPMTSATIPPTTSIPPATSPSLPGDATVTRPNQDMVTAGAAGPPTAAALGIVPPPSLLVPSTTPPNVPVSPEAPPANGSGVVPASPTPAGSTPPPTASGVPDVARGAGGDGGDGGDVPSRVGPEAHGLDVLPAQSSAVPPKLSTVAQTVPPATGSGAPALVPGAGHGDTRAAVAAGDGAFVSGHIGSEAPAAGTSSPDLRVDAATATLTQPLQGTDPAGPAGPPTAPGLAVHPPEAGPAGQTTAPGSAVGPGLSPVVPFTTSPTPLPTASVAPAAGRPDVSAFSEAVHQQVFTAVSPLLRGADGSYGIQLDLHPRDLGAVQVNLHVRHGEISIQLNASDPGARDALRSGLSDLRQQLEDQGLRAGSMDVGSGGANARQSESSWSRSQGLDLPGRGGSPSHQLVATPVAASNTALDLRM